METLLHVGLSNAALAAALAPLAAVVGRACRRPALAHSLWLLVLLKLVTPPMVGVPVAWPAAPAPEPPAPPALVWVEATIEDRGEATAGSEVEPAGAIDDPGMRGISGPAPAAPASAGWPVPAWEAVVLGVWLLGSATWMGLAGLRIARFGRLLRHARPAPVALCDQVEELARRLGLPGVPGVWLLPGCISPMLWAVGGRPRLLVPAELWERLDDDQRAALLVHELAHLRRRDHWVRSLELLAMGLYWWHPVVWWARRAMREAEEQCCDAWVVWALPDSLRAYATALLQTVDFLSETRPAVPVAASGMGHLTSLKRRMTMMMRRTTPRALTRAGRLSVLGLAAVLLPLAPTGAQQAKPDQPEAQPAAEAEVVIEDVTIDLDDVEIDRENPEIVYFSTVFDDDRDDEDDDEDEPRAKREARDDDERAESRAKAEEERREADRERSEAVREARAAVKEAEERLQQAVRRLAELEGRNARALFRIEARPGAATATRRPLIERRERAVIAATPRPPAPPTAAAAPAAPVAPVPPVPPGPPGVAPHGPGDVLFRRVPPPASDGRMEELEKKLDRLLDEVEKLKQDRRTDSPRGRDSGDRR